MTDVYMNNYIYCDTVVNNNYYIDICSILINDIEA